MRRTSRRSRAPTELAKRPLRSTCDFKRQSFRHYRVAYICIGGFTNLSLVGNMHTICRMQKRPNCVCDIELYRSKVIKYAHSPYQKTECGTLLLTIANSGSSVGSIPNSNPCPMGTSGAPSSPAKMGEERRTSDSKGPGWAVTKWLVWSFPFSVSINLANFSVFTSCGVKGHSTQWNLFIMVTLSIASG